MNNLANNDKPVENNATISTKNTLILSIKNNRVEDIKSKCLLFLSDFSRSKYNISFEFGTVEESKEYSILSINVRLEKDFISDIYNDIHMEFNENTSRLSFLKDQINSNCFNRNILDNRIDDLEERCEELKSQLSVLKMQLFYEMPKVDSFLSAFSNNLEEYKEDFVLTYNSFNSTFEQSLLDTFKTY